jgi:hypothetical protein
MIRAINLPMHPFAAVAAASANKSTMTRFKFNLMVEGLWSP